MVQLKFPGKVVSKHCIYAIVFIHFKLILITDPNILDDCIDDPNNTLW
jgi:hypothetical protein